MNRINEYRDLWPNTPEGENRRHQDGYAFLLPPGRSSEVPPRWFGWTLLLFAIGVAAIFVIAML